MYLLTKRVAIPWIILFSLVFFPVEIMFLIANLSKLQHGGWITLVIGILLSAAMYVWHKGKQIQKKFIINIPLKDQVPVLQQLSRDKEIPKYATHLIYLSNAENENMVEEKSISSILKAPIKKADIYWFVHINVTDEPYTMEYKVKMLVPNDIYHLTFNLGFRVQPKVDRFFRTVVEELTASGELVLEKTPDLKYSLNIIGDHKFILGDSFLSYDNKLSQWKNLLLKSYYSLKKIAVREEENFGLDKSNVLVEQYPLVVVPIGNIYLKRLVNLEEND
jgi:KUP system potassium uptake protein